MDSLIGKRVFIFDLETTGLPIMKNINKKREYDDYKIKKQLNDKEKREKEEVKNRMNRIEKDMQEIKEILLKLSNLGNKDGN